MGNQAELFEEDVSTISIFRRDRSKKTYQVSDILTNPNAPYRYHKPLLNTQPNVYNFNIDQFSPTYSPTYSSYEDAKENQLSNQVKSRYMDFYYKDLDEKEEMATCEYCSHNGCLNMVNQNWSYGESSPISGAQSPVQQTTVKRKQNNAKSRYMDYHKKQKEEREQTKTETPPQSYYQSFNTIPVYKNRRDQLNNYGKENENSCYVTNPRATTMYYDDPDRRSRLYNYIMDPDYLMKQLTTHYEEEEDLKEIPNVKPRHVDFIHKSHDEENILKDKCVSPIYSCSQEFENRSLEPSDIILNQHSEDEPKETNKCDSPTHSSNDVDLEGKTWKDIPIKSRYMDFYYKNLNDRKESGTVVEGLDEADSNLIPLHYTCPYEATETVISDELITDKPKDVFKKNVIKSRYMDWEKDRTSEVTKEPEITPNLDWQEYHRLSTIHKFLDDMQDNHPSICTTGVIGSSLENRELKVLKVSNSNVGNSSVWIDAGIHAREWIAPAVNTYMINYIVKNFDVLPECITNKDWYFLPVMNPDGYEFSHTNYRMWRKNKAFVGHECVGVDLNRNFSFGWGGKGSSDEPKSPFYHGPRPFSEPESRAVRDMLQSSGINFKVYITLHSFGEVILFPFAYRDELCPDYVRLLEGATVMSKAIYAANGNIYKVGISRDVMYGAAGTSCDWSYGEAKIPFCYLLELRSKKHKFRLPQIEIEETGKEILSCVMALMNFVDNYDINGNLIESPKM